MFKKFFDNFLQTPFEKEAQRIITEGISEENEEARRWFVKKFEERIKEVEKDHTSSLEEKNKTIYDLNNDLINIKNVKLLPNEYIKIWFDAEKRPENDRLFFKEFPNRINELHDRLLNTSDYRNPKMNESMRAIEATILGAKIYFFEEIKDGKITPYGPREEVNKFREMYSDLNKLVTDVENQSYL